MQAIVDNIHTLKRLYTSAKSTKNECIKILHTYDKKCAFEVKLNLC